MNLLDVLARTGLAIARRLDTPIPQRRGMAMIIVMAIVSLLSTSIVEFVYHTRVNLFLAQNQRDEVKAYFLARSGINLERLVLNYQYELENQPGMIGQAIKRSNFQLWQYLDLLLPTFSSAQLTSPIGSLDLTQTGASGFGGLAGEIDFERPEPEEGKINLNAFAGTEVDQQILQRFCALLVPDAYDRVLGTRAAEGLKARFEIIAALIDHIDPDSDLTVIDERCIATNGGAGNEVSRYRDSDIRPKNEPLVTLDEIFLVPGVTEAFMEQFRDQLTVYPVPKMFFVNLGNAQAFYGFLCQNLQGSTEQLTPCVVPQIQQQVAFIALALEGYVKFFENPFNVLGFYLGMSGGALAGAGGGQERIMDGLARGQMMAFVRERQFVSVLGAFVANPQSAILFAAYARPEMMQLLGYANMLGVDFVPPTFTLAFDETRMQRQISTDVPKIFSIRATGRYGAASRTIRAVVSFQEGSSKLVYWREY